MIAGTSVASSYRHLILFLVILVLLSITPEYYGLEQIVYSAKESFLKLVEWNDSKLGCILLTTTYSTNEAWRLLIQSFQRKTKLWRKFQALALILRSMKWKEMKWVWKRALSFRENLWRLQVTWLAVLFVPQFKESCQNIYSFDFRDVFSFVISWISRRFSQSL